MSTRYSARVCWTARRESPQEWAQRAERFFRLLKTCDPDFTQWYEKADSLEEALERPLVPDQPTLLRLLTKDEHREDLMDLSLSAWTGHTEEGRGAGVHVICGSRVGSIMPDFCVLNLSWAETPETAARVKRSTMSEIMRAQVLAWDPDWGFIADDDVSTALREESSNGTHVGWLTYISKRWGSVPALPDTLRVQPIEDRGALIVLTEKPFTVEQRQSMDLAMRVQKEMASQGLLQRLFPD